MWSSVLSVCLVCLSCLSVCLSVCCNVFDAIYFCFFILISISNSQWITLNNQLSTLAGVSIMRFNPKQSTLYTLSQEQNYRVNVDETNQGGYTKVINSRKSNLPEISQSIRAYTTVHDNDIIYALTSNGTLFKASTSNRSTNYNFIQQSNDWLVNDESIPPIRYATFVNDRYLVLACRNTSESSGEIIVIDISINNMTTTSGEILYRFGSNVLKDPVQLEYHPSIQKLMVLDSGLCHQFTLQGVYIGQLDWSNKSIQITPKSISYSPNGLFHILDSDSWSIFTFWKDNIYNFVKLNKSNIKFTNIASTDKGVYLSSISGIQYYKWEGLVVDYSFYSNGRVHIIGNGLSYTTDVIVDGSLQCQDLFVLSDSHISCRYQNTQIIANVTLPLFIVINNTDQFQNSNDTNQHFNPNQIITRESHFEYQPDGCPLTFWYDAVKNICKKSMNQSIYLYKYKLGNNITSRISFVSGKETLLCPNGWKYDSTRVYDIQHYRYLQSQTCWNSAVKTSTYTQIELYSLYDSDITRKEPTAGQSSSSSSLSLDIDWGSSLCSVPYDAPSTIDLSVTDNLFKFVCHDTNRSTQYILDHEPNESEMCNSTTTVGNVIDQIVLWSYFVPRHCVNGILNRDTGLCRCSKDWSGDNCDIPHCSVKSMRYNNSTRQCECPNKVCPNSQNQIFDKSTCNCICKLETPYKCSDDGRCVTKQSLCIKPTQVPQQPNNTNTCNSSHPYQCWNGQCALNADSCRQTNGSIDCLFQTCCWDGTPIDDVSNCPVLPRCLPPFSFRCKDGSCQMGASMCPPTVTPTPKPCIDSNCPEFDMCPPSFPYRCFNGQCVSYKDNCKACPKRHQQDDIFYQNQTNCPLPTFVKPITTQLTIPIGSHRIIHVYDTVTNLISIIDLFIPSSSFISLNQTEVIIRPVSTSYLYNLFGQQNDNNSVTNQWEKRIQSPILNITMPSFKDNSILLFNISISFRIQSNSTLHKVSKLLINQQNVVQPEQQDTQPTEEEKRNTFINTTTNQWQCIEQNLTSLVAQQHNRDIMMVTGETNHFTCFAVLLRSETYQDDSDEYQPIGTSKWDNNDLPTFLGVPRNYFIVSVFGVVGGVLLVMFGTVFYYSYKKYGMLGKIN
ncbi:hypothetical protein DFA_00361 [Cavenderia fasciculata]|uniref:EGF-like domain-containing protein n=1 Tax=Cavenderia fasciculata TaxID=261658 RepID=F4PRE8_CACFS|nr:uncharacterized protein DFA_00361 [Cavenderia fasciculata]EGG20500.1 hypothetical protein DFA_00361 [Cavenderia fasciculata]|eukprot:XP_004358350.1 hypothetical protein DFA_00361 [Cavenderia fasciculata]